MIKKIKDYWILFIVLIFVLYYPFIFFKTLVRDYVLDNFSETTKGVVIDKRNYIRNNRVSHSYTYSYEFVIDNKKYEQNSNSKKLMVGDTVFIEYYPILPSLNRLLKQKK